MRLSVVVPCFNEQDTVEEMAAALREILPKVTSDFEVIFVDDGSLDGTLNVLRRAAMLDPRLRYVALSRNFGKDAAMLAGLGEATGDAVAIMDADLQHPPEMLGDMLALLDKGYDQVVACRTRNGESWLRRISSWLYYRLVNNMVDVELKDGIGDYRMLSRRAVDAVRSLGEYNRFSKGLFAWIGFDTATIAYRGVARERGKSKFTPHKLVNYGIDGLISFNNKPLRLAIYVGGVVMLLSFGYAVVVVGDSLIEGVDTPGYTTLMAGVSGLGGLQLFLLGVIGEYLGRIYYETKGRPHFLVKEASRSALPGVRTVWGTQAATSTLDHQDALRRENQSESESARP
jgi:polyisoprenyl-phosphate glycosyltransferase